jgi:NADH:ubiquinone oxidoreductase subunit F (NADH-binding)
VRAEYPVAVRRLEQAIRQAKRHKLLGKNLFGSEFEFNVEIRIGAGAFVCGEETALMASIMGQRGTPVLRPPYPTERGLWGHPSMINNVETLANVPTIMRAARTGSPTSAPSTAAAPRCSRWPASSSTPA